MSLIKPTRRAFLTGLGITGAILCAPAIALPASRRIVVTVCCGPSGAAPTSITFNGRPLGIASGQRRQIWGASA